MLNNVVLSKMTGEYVPVKIKSTTYESSCYSSQLTEYNILYGRKNIGYVWLQDKDYGCYVRMIENVKPQEYGGVGELADKIEVQYCLNKEMSNFEIRSHAANNSHALHYLRGKRFEGYANVKKIKRFMEIFNDADIKSFRYDTIIKYIIDHTPNGERFNTKFLKEIPMYMPQRLIQKYIAELIKNPLIIK